MALFPLTADQWMNLRHLWCPAVVHFGFTRRRTGSRPSRPSPRSSGCWPSPRPPFGLPAAGDVAPLHCPRKSGVAKARPHPTASVLNLATRAKSALTNYCGRHTIFSMTITIPDELGEFARAKLQAGGSCGSPSGNEGRPSASEILELTPPRFLRQRGMVSVARRKRHCLRAGIAG